MKNLLNCGWKSILLVFFMTSLMIALLSAQTVNRDRHNETSAPQNQMRANESSNPGIANGNDIFPAPHRPGRQNLSTSLNSHRNALLFEDFESEEFPPPGWTMIDAEDKEWWEGIWYQNDWVQYRGIYCATSHSWDYPDNYLITPPINLPLRSIYLEYYYLMFEGYFDNFSVLISTTTPTIDAFTTIHHEPVGTSQWQKNHHDLSDFAGQTVYIAFQRHGPIDYGDGVAIDNIFVFEQHRYDIGAISISGTRFPSIGLQNIYSVEIRNFGFFTAENYLVRLMHDDIELASVSGIALQSFDSHIYELVWTPTSLGDFMIYGEIIWESDLELSNNKTISILIEIQPEDIYVAYIGNPDAYWWDEMIPVNITVASSKTQMLHYEEELLPGGLLTEISFKFNNTGVLPDNLPIQVYVAHTTKEEFSIWDFDAIPISDFTLVYDDDISLSQGGIFDVKIPLSEPFLYEGGTLAIMTYTPWLPDAPPIFNGGWQYSSTQLSNPGPLMNRNRVINVYHRTDIIDIDDDDWFWYAGGIYFFAINTKLTFSTSGNGNDMGDTIFPIQTTLKSNYPNPFNPSTTIAFDLAVESIVSIDIFNIRGQKVRVLVDDIFSIGSHTVEWNGTDEQGRSLASGIYFYRMQTEEYSSVKRMVLMK